MAAAAKLSDLPEDISESYITNGTSLRQRQRADLFSRGQYVSNVKIFHAAYQKFDIFAFVYRSQTKTESPHQVNLTIDATTKTVSDAFCTCKAGISGQCAHTLAVIFTLRNWILSGLKDVPGDASCTSLPQQWDKPRGPKIAAEPVATMVIAKPGNTSRKRKPITAIFDDNRKASLLQTDLVYLRTVFKDRSIGYLAQDCEETVSTKQGPQLLGSTLASQVTLIETMTAPSEVSLECGDVEFPKSPFIFIPECISGQKNRWSYLAITLCEARQLERDTKDQTTSSVWNDERKKRITASNFGRFMTRKAPITDTFLCNIFSAKPFVAASTSYGTANEMIARQLYIRQSRLHVHDCGLVVNPEFPFLGASPDGKVCDNKSTGIIEIKCPYSMRDMTVAEAVQSPEKRHLVCLEKVGDNIKLKKDHIYWYQVQGQLLVTGAPFCVFVCYTKQDLHVERILPCSPTMLGILKKLTDIYLGHVKDFLAGNKNDTSQTSN